MIVIGYQGIGKSTLASRDICYIDLESNNFFVDGKRADDWYKPYCKIAEHLSQQGYVVFTSSHEVVRNQLKNSNETVVVVYPGLELKDKWIEKLWMRYSKSRSEKDYKAYANAVAMYEHNIRELAASDIRHKIVLSDVDYDLDDELYKFERTIEKEKRLQAFVEDMNNEGMTDRHSEEKNDE